MKTCFLLITAILFSLQSMGQDRWTLQVNSKTLLTATKEDTTANVIFLNDLKKGSLIVTYTPGKVQNNFGRKLAVYDMADNELYARDALSITVPVATVKRWRYNHSQLKIFTWVISKDPAIKMKVRRVHLCTINSK